MRSQAGMAVICGLVFALQSSHASAAGREARDACSFLSESKVSAILGVAIDAGRHIGPSNALCGWGEPGDPDHSGKHALLTIYRAVGKISPVERFENGKMPIQGIEKTPVSGIGDEAYYIDTPGFGVGLNVKKGNFAFQVKVFGFSPQMIKAMENSLAQDVLTKL
ncbi:MAG TPA: hypothetical protein VK743_04790 [Steroidobacteraceae bacterium]|jgi:hypothetical protein|nr:hypothetical protein [Steroidobacteraceae bacterium]